MITKPLLHSRPVLNLLPRLVERLVDIESSQENFTVTHVSNSETLGFGKSFLISTDDFSVPLDFLQSANPPFAVIARLPALESLQACN